MGRLTFQKFEKDAESALQRAEEAAGKALHGAEEALRSYARPSEPRWPAIVSGLAVGGLHYALPPTLVYPVPLPWLLPLIVAVLMIPNVLTLRLGNHRLNQIFGFTTLGVLTLAELWSLFLLVSSLLYGWPAKLAGDQLLRSAAALWLTNIVVFALWYWRIDAGGPNMRDQRSSHTQGAFLFPQMTLDADQKEAAGVTFWSPMFMDYFFIAFTQSTSFAPADTGVMSRWVKFLVIIQSTISLITVAAVAGRAINILQ